MAEHSRGSWVRAMRERAVQKKQARTDDERPEDEPKHRQPGPVRNLTSAFLSHRAERHSAPSPEEARQLRISREEADDPGEDEDAPEPARRFSATFMVALIIAIALLVGTYPTLNNFFSQSREIEQTRQNIAQLQQENDQLKVEKTWWDDENYVRQQARSRLFYVSQGDTPYVVTGIDANTTEVDDTSASAKNAPDNSWTNKMWNSVQHPQSQQPGH